MKFLALTILTTSLAQAGVNDHFHCTSPQFFNRLEVELVQEKETNRVTLKSFDANRAAKGLGIGGDGAMVNSLELNIPKDWCTFSDNVLAVFRCNLPQRSPPLNIEVTARNHEGKVTASTTLNHLAITIDHVVRTSAGFEFGLDWVQHQLEFDASMISEKDNAKRAKLALPFEVTNCGRP